MSTNFKFSIRATRQSMVDQRAADGWRLAAVSAYSHPAGSTSVERVVLVFEKE